MWEAWADPRVGIELPLRMLIWQDADGTHVGYIDPRELSDPTSVSLLEEVEHIRGEPLVMLE